MIIDYNHLLLLFYKYKSDILLNKSHLILFVINLMSYAKKLLKAEELNAGSNL
jgi:hypothetical protein